MNNTFVTAYFDLGKIENNDERRQKDDYFKHAEFILSQDINLIIFIEPENQYHILEQRKDFMHKTHIITIEFNQLEYADQMDIIKRNLSLNPVFNFNPIKDTPEYLVTIWNKFYFLKRSISIDPFNSSHFAWIDFGITYIPNITLNYIEEDRIFQELSEKIKLLILRDFNPNEFQNLKDYFSRIRGISAGGFITGSLDNMLWLSNTFIQELKYAIKYGFSITEQQLLPLIISEYPDYFNPYYGDYWNIFSNYRKQRENYSRFKKLKTNMDGLIQKCKEARIHSDHQKSYKLARQILESRKNSYDPINEDLSIVCYYLGKKDEGFEANERILRSEVSNHIKFQALANTCFYVQPINLKFKKNITYGVPKNYYCSTPAIIKTKTGFRLNLRAVNYQITSTGQYNIKGDEGIVRTKNFILDLDSTLYKYRDFRLKDYELNPRYPGRIEGLEDIRLFEFKDKQYFFATCCECIKSRIPRIVLGEYDLDGNISFIKHLTIGDKDNSECEKNWLPFVNNEQVYFIYSFNPLKIYRLDMDTYETELYHIDKEKDDFQYRGSAPPISYKNGWLLTIHQVHYSNPRKYYHRFVWYSKDFQTKKYSRLFYFEKIGIEYNLSICESSEGLLITYSVNDASSNIGCIDYTELDQMLEFSDYLNTTYMYQYPEESNREKKICLSMIVKNESKIITRCLSSALHVIDYISICDTGSTDNTVEVITNFCETNGIKYKIHNHEWKNFGHNRTLSYYAARDSFPDTDYVLLLDADMVLKVNDVFDSQELVKGGYMIPQGNSSIYYFNIRLMSTKYNWKCIGVTHEYWSPESKEYTQENITSLEILDLGDGGCKQDKFERDVRLLTQGLKDEPNNPRYMFYLAQSYTDIGEWEKGIEWYQKRIDAGGWFEEIYYSYYRIAWIKLQMGLEWDQVMKSYLDAWNYCPQRIEPLYDIGMYYYDKQEWDQAYKWLKKASEIPFPKHLILFISKHIYEFRVWLNLGVAAYYADKYKESIDANIKALKSSYCDQEQEKLIRNNMKFSIEKLKE